MLSFQQLVDYYSLFEHEVISLLEVDKRTLSKWITHDSAPNWARKLVAIHGRGYLPSDPEWHEFSIKKGVLLTPFKRFELRPCDIMAMWYVQKRLNILDVEIKRLRQKNERLKQLYSASNESIFDADGKLKQLTLI